MGTGFASDRARLIDEAHDLIGERVHFAGSCADRWVFAKAFEPIFNVPTVVSRNAALLVLVHTLRAWVLTPEQTSSSCSLFSFIPARYERPRDPGARRRAGGLGAQIWTFVTYAFIHGDWAHLGLNGVWLLAFGTPVARRFGSLRSSLFLP